MHVYIRFGFGNYTKVTVDDQTPIRDLIWMLSSQIHGLDSNAELEVYRGDVCVAQNGQLNCTAKELGFRDNDYLDVFPTRTEQELAPDWDVPRWISCVVHTLKLLLPEGHRIRRHYRLTDEAVRKFAKTFTPEGIAKLRQDNDRERARQYYLLMRNGTGGAEATAKFDYRELYDQFHRDKYNFEGFLAVYRDAMARVKRERVLMSDPTNAEGVRLREAYDNKQAIFDNYAHALEHRPELLISSHMLYVKMKINGVDVNAFIDTGAQVSVMSEVCALRTNMFRLVDTNFRSHATGVGGTQEIIGRIHACQLQVEDTFTECRFEVMRNRDIELLIGLNVLRANRCKIDFENNVLVLDDGTMAPFLPAEEVVAIMAEERRRSSDYFVVDDEALTELTAFGFAQDRVVAALKQCNNNRDLAAIRLMEEREASEQETDRND